MHNIIPCTMNGLECLQLLRKPVLVQEIKFNEVYAVVGQQFTATAATYTGPDVKPPFETLLYNKTADKATCAGNQDFHLQDFFNLVTKIVTNGQDIRSLLRYISQQAQSIFAVYRRDRINKRSGCKACIEKKADKPHIMPFYC